jgi:GAF domain-containing protein
MKRKTGTTGTLSDKRRVKILREFAVLDSAPESQFDDLAAMAAQICETPIALISLVDADRQWFKARVGLDVRETPRTQSFCAHALKDPQDVMVVPDAAQDERFSSNPLVTGKPNIRFYAGAPLVTQENTTLGTICVIDRVPRELTVAQQWALKALASQVVKKLENRLQNLKKIEWLTEHINDLKLQELEGFFCLNRVGWAQWLRLVSFCSVETFLNVFVGGESKIG